MSANLLYRAWTAQVIELYSFFVNRKNKIETLLSFSISFPAFKFFRIQCVSYVRVAAVELG